MEQVIYQDGVFKVIGENTATTTAAQPQTMIAPAPAMPEKKGLCKKYMEEQLKIQRWEKTAWVLATVVMVLAGLTFFKALTKAQ